MDNVTGSSTEDSTEMNSQFTLTEYIFYVTSMVVCLVVFLLGTTGNGLVIWIAGFRMKKTTNSVWLINLTIADFLFAFCMSLLFVYYVLYFHWPFGTFMCKLWITLISMKMFTTAFLLTAISIDQCVSVVHPVWSQNHRTPRSASLVALIIWLLALCASVPYFVFTDTYFIRDDFIMCYFDYGHTYGGDSGNLNFNSTVTTELILGFFVPFAVIVFCYTVIAFKLKRNPTFTATKPFKIIAAVLISFFVCWLPNHLFSFLTLFWYTYKDTTFQRILNIGTPITVYLTYVHSFVNPFIYFFMGREVKGISRNSIQVALENAFSEGSPQTYLKMESKTTVESSLV